jgi:hypothetical protein
MTASLRVKRAKLDHKSTNWMIAGTDELKYLLLVNQPDWILWGNNAKKLEDPLITFE